MTEVTLEMMLLRREKRVLRQKELLGIYHVPLMSFSMNIAGPYKTDKLTECCFLTGLRQITGCLAKSKIRIVHKEYYFLETGPEAFLCVDFSAEELKKIAVEIEDSNRLYDIDVISIDSVKLERSQERKCLICDNPAKVCSSRRLHPLAEIQQKTNEILQNASEQTFAHYVSGLAVRALMFEVAATPKPGLVDRNNNGSHSDMDFYTFITGSASLFSYFTKAFIVGLYSDDIKKCFVELRKLGKEAENELFYSTEGINTHKGSIFTLGLLVCASAVEGPKFWKNPERITSFCARMAEGLIENDLKKEKSEKTNGEKLYAQLGISGIRGEIENGLPAVREGLTVLENRIAEGKNYDEASYYTILKIISQIRDTCLISRGGLDEEKKVRKMASEILEIGTDVQDNIIKMDKYFIEKNLSPGGAADLLSACWFLHFLKEEVK